jgi:hypothetical protein
MAVSLLAGLNRLAAVATQSHTSAVSTTSVPAAARAPAVPTHTVKKSGKTSKRDAAGGISKCDDGDDDDDDDTGRCVVYRNVFYRMELIVPV